MKGVIVYDSYYGNTQAVAEAIAGQLQSEGHEVVLRSVRDHRAGPDEGDVLFLGSPVRMGAVTHRANRYARKLDITAWRGKPIFVFTTILRLPDDATDEQHRSQDRWDRGAGRKLRDLIKSKGLDAREEMLWVEVAGMKGPLVADGLEVARSFAHGVMDSMREPVPV